jgi:hypothetical protein
MSQTDLDIGLVFQHQSQCSLIQKLLREKKLLREERQVSPKLLWKLQKKKPDWG